MQGLLVPHAVGTSNVFVSLKCRARRGRWYEAHKICSKLSRNCGPVLEWSFASPRLALPWPRANSLRLNDRVEKIRRLSCCQMVDWLPKGSAVVSNRLEVLIFSLKISLVFIWALTYVMDWLHKLDSATGLREGPISFMEDPTSLEKIPLPSLSAPAEKYLSLIMPAYNEEDRLRNTLDDTLRYLRDRADKDRTFTYEIIIVDDGSNDNTVRVAFEYVKKHKLDIIRVIKQGKNYGKGAAVRKGMQCSRGQLLLMVDADGATKISDAIKLENEIKSVFHNLLVSRSGVSAQISDIPVAAFGSRAHLEERALAKRKWYRNVLMKGFHFCVLLVAGPGIRDTQCGFKMFTRSAARQLFTNMRLNRWCFDVELVYLCKRIGIPVLEVAVTWMEIPGSKIKPLSIMHMLFELVLVRLGYGFRVWKLH